ncbi:MAG: hypothetical protein NT074_05610 [Methanomicrobiales archaeon]|nr:hypothetical protein [Methanomicrobiales archaeon]
MQCWRDLAHECAEIDCPMWMESFDLLDLVPNNEMGLNESRCALVLREKLRLFQSIMEMASFADEDDEEELETLQEILAYMKDHESPEPSLPERPLSRERAIPEPRKAKGPVSRPTPPASPKKPQKRGSKHR